MSLHLWTAFMDAIPLTPQSRIAAAAFTVVLMLINLELIGRCQLRRTLFNAGWFLAAFGSLALAAFPGPLAHDAAKAGVADANLALFAIAFALLLGLVFNLSLAIPSKGRGSESGSDREKEGAR